MIALPRPQSIRRTALLIALLLGAASLCAEAQVPDSASKDTTAKRLHAVVVTESREAAVAGGTSAIVIHPQQLRTPPAPLLEEALRESPFILVRQNSRGEMELSVRGSDSRQAAVLFDGVPLTLGWDHRTDPSLIPLTGVQTLSIVRGLSSVLHGPNTLGGIVEIGHEEDGRATSSAWLGSSVQRGGSRVLTAGAGGPVGQLAGGSLAMRGGVGYRERDGLPLGAGIVDTASRDRLRTNSDLRQLDAFASVRWSGALGRALGLTVSGYDAERGVPPELHVQEPRLWRYPRQSRVFAALSSSSGALATPFGIATVNVGGGLNVGKAELQSYSDMRYRSVLEREVGDERTITGRAIASHSLPNGGQWQVAGTIADVRYLELLDDAPASRYRQRLWSAATEVQWPLDARVSFSGGLVLDGASTPETGGREPQEALSAGGWRLGWTYDPTPDTRLHAGASARARFPSLRELYSGALNRFQPNPDLEPERLLGFEGGVSIDRRFGPLPDVRLQAVGFHHRLRDAVVRITQPDGRFMRVNRDRLVSTGVELLGGWVASENRERAITVTGDAMFQQVQLIEARTGSERRPEHQPERRAMLEVGVPLPLAMRAYGNTRYTGPQYCLHPDLGREIELRAQSEVNVALERSWPLSRSGIFKGVRALLAMDNVGNDAVYDQCGLPQPGRMIRFGIELG